MPRFYTRVERVLRRSLGVSETAETDAQVKPAPPVDPTLEEEGDKNEGTGPHFDIPSEWKDKVSITMEEVSDEADAVHDEL